MHPDKSSLSIRLTEPVVPLRSTPERGSRHHDGEIPPPAIVRGLLTLKLAKPTKVSNIELELQANAITSYAQGLGPSRIDVTEQYNVHSASTVVFKADPLVQQRATSMRPRVQFLDAHTGSDIQHSTRTNGADSRHLRAPSDPRLVIRSASLDPSSPRVRQQLSSDDPEIGGAGNPQRDQMSNDLAPPYPSPAAQHSFLSADPYLSVADRSQSVGSSSRATDPRGTPILSRGSPTPECSYGSPTSSLHSLHRRTLSRTSSIEEVPEDEDSIAYYGLSRIATSSSGRSSEQSHRGRSHSRFAFRRVVHVFDAVKDRVRSQSPRTGSRPRSSEPEERGRPLRREKGKAPVGTHGVGHVLPQIGVVESAATDDPNDQSDDGWVMFPEGTYTYPILFTIPNNSPPTTKADYGSLIWRVKAEVKRPGAFKSKMTAQKEVIVVCLPEGGDPEEGEGIDLQREWDGQFQYRVQIPARSFPVGGKVPFQLTITPFAKIKVHCILAYLDERTQYYTRAQSQASEAIQRATLLTIKHNNLYERCSEPILPLASGEPDEFRKSPLYRFLSPGEDESEAASSFMGPGPWTIRHQLRLPDSCSILHPSNQTKGSNVMVNHTLKIILRVEKEGTATTGREKLYDIVIHIPVRILSCHCTSELASLPRYDEAIQSEGDSPQDTLTCPCRTRDQAKAQTHTHAVDTLRVLLERVTSHPTNLNPSGALGAFPSDSPAGRTYLHEQLMSGLVSETGEAPPSYERFRAVSV